jgi:hypothetical protein
MARAKLVNMSEVTSPVSNAIEHAMYTMEANAMLHLQSHQSNFTNGIPPSVLIVSHGIGSHIALLRKGDWMA